METHKLHFRMVSTKMKSHHAAFTHMRPIITGNTRRGQNLVIYCLTQRATRETNILSFFFFVLYKEDYHFNIIR